MSSSYAIIGDGGPTKTYSGSICHKDMLMTKYVQLVAASFLQ